MGTNQLTISEQFIVGAILKQPKAALTIIHAQKTSPAWFEQPTTNACMKAIFELIEKNEDIEPATVLKKIHTHNKKTTIVIDDLHHCVKMCSSTSYLLQHVLSLKDRRNRIEIEQILDVGKQKLEGGVATHDLIEEMKWLINGLTTPAKTTSGEVIQEILHLYDQSAKQGFSGIPSRWPAMTKILGGYPRGGVTVVSGLTKHGKTTYACNEVLSMCRGGYRVLFLSLEMNEGQIRAILAGDELDIDLLRLRTGRYGEEQDQMFEQFGKCLNRHKELPITIADGSKTIEEIDSMIRGAAGEYDMVVIDHLHLIRRGQRDPAGKEERLSLYSNTITNSVVDANVSSILIAQLSRDGLVDHKGDPVAPEPRHLKGSGSIEQDLTQLVMIYQNPTAGRELVPDQSPTLCKVALNRLGTVGKEKFVFLKSKQKLIAQEMWDLHKEKEGDEF